MREHSTFTRRQFLHAAGAVSAPLVLPAAVFAAPPSERITIGAIGVGNMGTQNLKGFLWARQTQVLAVCDVDSERREAARELVDAHYAKQVPSGVHEGCAGYEDFRDLLARDDIDAVVVSTPDHWHVLCSLYAVKAGKDVYCEKPLTAHLAEGRALSAAVRRYGRVFQMGSQQRSDRRFRFACELVRNGRIGQLKAIEVGLPKGRSSGPPEPMPVPDGFAYDLWLGPAPWAPYTEARCHYNFRFISDYSGGQMLNWGSHHVDIAQWGHGTDRTGPVEVVGTGQYPADGLYDNPVTYSVDYRYEDGVTLNCSTSNRNGVRFEGTEGWVFVTRGLIDAQPKSLLNAVIGSNEIRLYDSGSHKGNFLECMRTRAETVAPVEVGHRSASMCHLGNIAMLLGRRLRWDPAQERFIDDPEADRLVARAMRGPWRV